MKARMIAFMRARAIYCLSVGIAVAIAFLLSHGSDPTGSLYAVLAAALVIGETTGEGIGISRNRMIGSMLGVVIAIPVAALGPPSVWTVAGACVVTAGIALAIGEIAVARIATTVTIVSILVHPGDVPHYGLYRITNTALGIAVAIGVSYAFWPIMGRSTLTRVMRAIIVASADLLQTVAESDRMDLLRRRRWSLFSALAAVPKARKEANQDPLLIWGESRRLEPMQLVVEIGVYALTMSAAVWRLAPPQAGE
jgi:uncharacterized membrane protein YccC